MDESGTTTSSRTRQYRDTTAASDLSSKSRFPKHLQAAASRRNRGVAMLWVVIFLFLIILIVGLGLDGAKAFLVAHQLQNAADAAALAGACVVKLDPNDARQTAIAVALKNFADGNAVELVDNPGNSPDGDVVVGWYSRMLKKFVPALSPRNAVKVVARRTDASPGGPVPLNFGPVVGVDDVDITRYAIAMTYGGTGAGVIALSPEGIGLKINGTVGLFVNDGLIQVNSEDDNGANLIGTPDIWAEALNVCGDMGSTGGIDLDSFDFPLDNQAPYMPDPFCPDPPGNCLPPPTWNPGIDLSGGETMKITEGVHLLEPGYYSGGFSITGGDVTLKPGIYILGGGPQGKGGLVVGGNANLCAKGVVFYVTENGKVDLAGSGTIRVTPPDLEVLDFCDPNFSYPADPQLATYTDVSIFQDRANTNDARIVGTNLLELEGALYFPRNHVDLTGTGDGFGNQLVAWTIEVSGTGDIVINYRGDDPKPSNKSFLIE